MNTTKYRINRERSTMDFGSLTVLNVRFSDRGTYRCNASNDVGSVTASADLTVHGKFFHTCTCSSMALDCSSKLNYVDLLMQCLL